MAELKTGSGWSKEKFLRESRHSEKGHYEERRRKGKLINPYAISMDSTGNALDIDQIRVALRGFAAHAFDNLKTKQMRRIARQRIDCSGQSLQTMIAGFRNEEEPHADDGSFPLWWRARRTSMVVDENRTASGNPGWHVLSGANERWEDGIYYDKNLGRLAVPGLTDDDPTYVVEESPHDMDSDSVPLLPSVSLSSDGRFEIVGTEGPNSTASWTPSFAVTSTPVTNAVEALQKEVDAKHNDAEAMRKQREMLDVEIQKVLDEIHALDIAINVLKGKSQ